MDEPKIEISLEELNKVWRCMPMWDVNAGMETLKQVFDSARAAHELKAENESLKRKIAELEHNEREYERIVGPKSFNEVAEEIETLREQLRHVSQLKLAEMLALEAEQSIDRDNPPVQWRVSYVPDTWTTWETDPTGKVGDAIIEPLYRSQPIKPFLHDLERSNKLVREYRKEKKELKAENEKLKAENDHIKKQLDGVVISQRAACFKARELEEENAEHISRGFELRMENESLRKEIKDRESDFDTLAQHNIELQRLLNKKVEESPDDIRSIGDAEQQTYRIGGYAPGNYFCRCVDCKKEFIGDKRAIQCEPCAREQCEPQNKPRARTSVKPPETPDGRILNRAHSIPFTLDEDEELQNESSDMFEELAKQQITYGIAAMKDGKVIPHNELFEEPQKGASDEVD